MDNQNQQTNNQATQPSQSANGASSGYLISERVDPNQISSDQVNSDLEALKKAEAIIPSGSKAEEAIKEETVEYDPDKSQVAAALELKNPFRGE